MTNSINKHIHDFSIQVEVHVPVRNYVPENGKLTPDLITARDTLKQFKCSGCEATTTYDLERTKIA